MMTMMVVDVGPRLFIDNLDSAAGTLALFRSYFEDDSIKKVAL